MKIRENILLVQQAYGRINGANIHRGTATIQAYRNAIDLATDRRCRDRKMARAVVARAEAALRSFCGWSGGRCEPLMPRWGRTVPPGGRLEIGAAE
jgi:hypothetical protein